MNQEGRSILVKGVLSKDKEKEKCFTSCWCCSFKTCPYNRTVHQDLYQGPEIVGTFDSLSNIQMLSEEEILTLEVPNVNIVLALDRDCSYCNKTYVLRGI